MLATQDLNNLTQLTRLTGRLDGLRAALTAIRTANSLEEAEIAVGEMLDRTLGEGATLADVTSARRGDRD